MNTGIHNWKLKQGATFSETMTWKIDRNPVNLAGYTAKLEVRSAMGGRTAANSLIVALTTENGGIALGGIAGTITLRIAADKSRTLLAGKHVYDLELTSPAGVTTYILEGDFVIKSEVTR